MLDGIKSITIIDHNLASNKTMIFMNFEMGMKTFYMGILTLVITVHNKKFRKISYTFNVARVIRKGMNTDWT